jgi:hypothetical protein
MRKKPAKKSPAPLSPLQGQRQLEAPRQAVRRSGPTASSLTGRDPSEGRVSDLLLEQHRPRQKPQALQDRQSRRSSRGLGESNNSRRSD